MKITIIYQGALASPLPLALEARGSDVRLPFASRQKGLGDEDLAWMIFSWDTL